MARGRLRVYLGAAPGVGKTFAMLNEGRRRAARSTDVVIGYVETHGRANTGAQIGELEVIPRLDLSDGGICREEMDLEAVLARMPQVALVDELAHTNVVGSEHEKRWEDVEVLLEAGIDVISTVNVQQLESLSDVVEAITGAVQSETIPDEVVRRADQIELVDMAPEAIRRRMAHGNIYPPEQVDAVLADFFRLGNLGALRELALMWLADRVDEWLESYRDTHDITRVWETRERVVVAITGAPDGARAVRRAARMAMRARGDLLGVHVRSPDGLTPAATDRLDEHRRLLLELGGAYHEIAGADVADTLLHFTRAENGTQLVLGASRQSRWAQLTHGSIINRVIRRSGPVDVHVISGGAPSLGPQLPRVGRSPLPRRRIVAGWCLAVLGPPLVTLLLAQLREVLDLPADLLLFLLLVVLVGLMGGVLPAIVAALCGSLLATWFFTAPRHQLEIADAENLVALVVFVIVGVVVSVLVDVSARRAVEAARARADAETLAALGGTLAAERDPLPALVGQLRSAFEADAVAVLHRRADGWSIEAAAGEPVPQAPADASTSLVLGDDDVLAVVGALRAEDLDVLQSFASQLRVATQTRRLRSQAARANELAEANELRTALLAAVSHDLRTPLASIKASVSSLRQRDVAWSEEVADDFLETIDEETDRLTALVGNLLDMSRLQTGTLSLVTRDVGFDEVVPRALAALGARAERVTVDVPETLPRVHGDVALIERAIVNVVDNALGYSPVEQPVRVVAGGVGDRVELRVVDRGQGVPPEKRDRMFEPFQRLGDAGNGSGVGLGLAVARGFVEVMGGTLRVEDTPGGGLTMVLAFPT